MGPYKTRPLPVLAVGSRQARITGCCLPTAPADCRLMATSASPRPGRAGVGRAAWRSSARCASGSPRERPLAGVSVAACLHVTAETANFVRCLGDGGAEVALCSANPHSTQDDTAAALAADGVEVRARRGDDAEVYAAHVKALAAGRAAGHGGRRRRPDHGAPRARPRRGRARRHRGDPHGPAAPAPPGRRRRAALPRARRERLAHRARLQRPLWHRPVGARRSPARHQPAPGRPHARAARATATRARASPSARAARAPPWWCARWIRCGRSRRGWRATR